MSEQDDSIVFAVNSIFGFMTGEPYVNVQCGKEKIQMSPTKAREIGYMMIEAAEAADLDACVVNTLNDIGMNMEDIGRFLLALRQKREELNA